VGSSQARIELDAIGYEVPSGTYEDAKAMVGRTTPIRFGHVDVNQAMIRHYAAMVRDPNPSYWDHEFAAQQWGAIVAPPAMLMTWLIPIEWQPAGGRPVPLLTAQVPLPGDTFLNASNDTELLEPIRVGDHLSVVEQLTDVSEEKRTALGLGHFVTTLSTYRRQDGTVVARSTNVLFRFTPETTEGAPT
jgi:acyl dehydratase